MIYNKTGGLCNKCLVDTTIEKIQYKKENICFTCENSAPELIFEGKAICVKCYKYLRGSTNI